MPEDFAFSLPADAAPKIKALYDYWQSIHPPGGGLPGRRHLDPLDIPELLPNIWMIDVKRSPQGGVALRFRFRLVGTEIVKFTGRDVTGSWLDQVYPDYENTAAFRAHRDCAEHGVPGYRKSGVLSNPGRTFIEAERLSLPLAEDGRRVGILLVMTLYRGEPPRPRGRM
ncbi:MAG: PAS domain-containing protein [Kiloniellaceae bacterium]